MARDEIVELTDEQLGRLIRRLLGPPEKWDDDAAEFVLRIYGIDPADTARYVKGCSKISFVKRGERRTNFAKITRLAGCV